MARAMYFVANDGLHGFELWRTNAFGSSALVADIVAGVNSSSISYLTPYNGELYFSAFTPTFGAELWKVTVTGLAVFVADIYSGSSNGNPTNLTVSNGDLFFSAGESAFAVEPYRVRPDGTVQRVADIATGAFSSLPSGFTPFNGETYFTAADLTGGYELWKVRADGATVQVADIYAGANSSTPQNFKSFNGELYFAATDLTFGNELWKVKADGGVVRAADIYTAGAGSNPSGFTVFNGEMYFAATDATFGNEVWKVKADKSVVRVSDILPGVGNANPTEFTLYNNELYFAAKDNGVAIRLMKIKADGTVALGATTLPTVAGASPTGFTVFNGEMYFSGSTATAGFEPLKLKADGTVEMVFDINGANGASSSPIGFTVFDGVLYFQATSFGSGAELWSVNRAGQVNLVDINSGAPGSVPSHFVVMGSIQGDDFTANGASDILWRNDSTALAVWTMSGAAGTTILTGNGIGSTPDSNWVIQGTGDFSGDGKGDILWRRSTDGLLAIWAMGGASGTTVQSGNGIGSVPGLDWHVQGIGDFNGDGQSDIFWRNDSGALAVWTMGGNTGTAIQTGSSIGSTPDGAWRVVGNGDFNGDGASDILWRNNQSGVLVVWTMGGADGATVLTGNAIGSAPGLDWHVRGTGDFNGDGRSDILWRNDNGALAVWTMGGAAGTTIFTGAGIGSTPDASWSIEATGDYNADAQSDILWRKSDGTLAVWTMGGATGTTIGTGNGIGSVPATTWHVQKHDYEVV